MAGRIRVKGRTLRYEAGSDICYVARQILKEFVEDYEQGRFMCDQDQTVERIRPLLAWAECMERGEVDNELHDQKLWLYEVADLLPRLWD